MIHVLHVLSSLGRGGAERVVVDLIARADKTRFRHTVCYLSGPHDLRDELRAAGGEAICLDLRGKADLPRAALQLRRLIRDLGADVVQSATFEANIAARLAVLGTGVPLVNWLVSMEYDPESVRAAGWSARSNALRRLIDKTTSRLARPRFIACAEVVRRSALDRLGLKPELVEVIYNPVDPANLQAGDPEVEALRAELALGVSDFIYFTVGRMDAAKDHRTLIEAFARVADAHPNARLVLVGRGVLREKLHDLAGGLGLAERVRFVEWAPRIAPYLAIADVFVFPSLLEGLPVAVLEAMCAGVPTIASDISPHLEVVSDGVDGVIVPRGNADALAVAMSDIFIDTARRQAIGAGARHSAVPRFGIEAIAPQWEALYSAMASRRASAAP